MKRQTDNTTQQWHRRHRHRICRLTSSFTVLVFEKGRHVFVTRATKEIRTSALAFTKVLRIIGSDDLTRCDSALLRLLRNAIGLHDGTLHKAHPHYFIDYNYRNWIMTSLPRTVYNN